MFQLLKVNGKTQAGSLDAQQNHSESGGKLQDHTGAETVSEDAESKSISGEDHEAGNLGQDTEIH